ncbi:sigma-70 family RNA polymerase sigma factor [Aeoliella mucimassa]|uniref:RNA polymerase sigma factor n=1 Tax=Aeoliella mucimassa TaxID=2527972 RepID=A0A518AJY1_9BACT|nr:sigma-70 family RNA polymerase sigma factor [Aeoliella mucimassa]QDU55032.1 RNA polymerase sigma factor [Aeoliella mucimassa]
MISGNVSRDDEGFVTAIAQSQRDLRAFIVSLIPHSVDADDVLQEVNLALWRKRHTYDSEQLFLRWAIGFAAMEVRSFRSRDAKSRLWYSEEAIMALTSDWTATDSFREETHRMLSGCIDKLGDQQRSFIEERYRNQASVKQIATQTGKPASTVYKILAKSIRALRECVKRSQREQFG